MIAVWCRARGELRARWKATLLLALLFGLVGGVVMASFAGARRTREALGEFVEWSNPEDVSVFDYVLVTEAEAAERAQHIVDLPMVASSRRAGYVIFGEVDDQGRIVEGDGYGGLMSIDGNLDDFHRYLVVEGRLPDPTDPYELAVNEPLADHKGLEPGDQLTLAVYSNEQTDLVARGDVTPAHGLATMTVTGILREPADLAFEPEQQEGTIYDTEAEEITLGGALWQKYDGDLAGYGSGVMVELRDDADLADFTTAVDELLGGGLLGYESSETETMLESVDRAIDRQADALLVFGALVGLVGFAIAGQAMARQVALGSNDVEVLSAVGMTRGQRAAAAALWGAVVAVVATALAVAAAVALSQLSPIGMARRAELDPGMAVDGAVIAVGCALLLLAVPAWAAIKGWRTGRAGLGVAGSGDGRTSSIGSWLARVGGSAPSVAGVRMALAPGRGRTAVPVRSALAALVVGIGAVTAALTFAVSLDRLATTPELRGWNWDYVVGNYSDTDSAAQGRELLRSNPDVEAFSGFDEAPAESGGAEFVVGFVTTEDGVVSAPVLEGRHPLEAHEIAVGPGTLDDLGKQIGDEIDLVIQGFAVANVEIVGTVIPPVTAGASDMTLAEGGVFTWDVITETLPPDIAELVVPTSYLVRLDDSAGPGAADRLREDFPGTVLSPVSTRDIESLRVVDDLPYLLAAVAALLGLGTLTHTLVTAVRRRRRDLATLRALGFSGWQVRATVGWQALAFTTVALVVGIPLGVALGRAAWWLVADSLGSGAGPVTPTLALAAVAVAVVVLGNLVAAGPAWMAARLHPAAALRAE